jgi:hypothetical protein
MSSIVQMKAAQAAKNLRVQAERQTHSFTVAGTGLALGMYEGSGRKLPTIVPGIDPKLQLGIVAALIADRSSGTVRTVARGGADMLIGIATYQMGRQWGSTGTSVAGYDVAGPGDEVIDV